MSDCLVLNSDYKPLTLLPLSLCDWRTAIKLTYLNRFTIHAVYDDWHARSQHLAVPIPAIIVSKRYHKTEESIKYNRRNLYLRDLYSCQYCGETFGSKDLTIDHVLPRSMGGKNGWENTVTACKPCNSFKGNKLMKPLRAPKQPGYWNIANRNKIPAHMIKHESWLDFLPVDLEQVA